MLINRDEIRTRFLLNLNRCDHLDIAVAWATSGWAWSAIKKRGLRKDRLRLIIGTSGHITQPSMLRTALDIGHLKITQGQGSIFHPKFLLFRGGAQRVAWTGSSNLTDGGFGKNDELVHEYVDEDRQALNWFLRLWKSLDNADDAAIRAYEKRRKVPPPHRASPSEHRRVRQPKDHPVSLLTDNKVRSWKAFVHALHRCEKWWGIKQNHFSILADEWSYKHTIRVAREIIERRSWDRLDPSDVNVLLPFRKETDGAWGLLGSTRRAHGALKAFKGTDGQSRNIRRRVKAQVDMMYNSSEREFAQNAKVALERISKLDGFGAGVATRLFTLARPDRAVSVNNRSRYGLSQIFDMPATTLGTPGNYQELLERLHRSPWFDVPRPDEPEEAEIWDIRAALIDSFAYQPEE